MNTLNTASRSARGFVLLVPRHKLHLVNDHFGKIYEIADNPYTVFRETRCTQQLAHPTILVVGFRLRFLRSNTVLHWCFQRLCIITTPFWSGLKGFRVKLWMVDKTTQNYLGIYDWRGAADAQAYIDFLIPILRFFSVKDSVWYKMYDNTELETYLEKHV